MEEDLERVLGAKGKELQQAIEDLRLKEFSYQVGELRCTLPSLNRCVICTLQLPCKHFKSIQEMPTPPIPTKERFHIEGYSWEDSPVPQSPKKFEIRFRGRDSESTNPKLKSHTQQRTVSLPNAQRLKLIEKIEIYREEKIRKEIQKIKELKEAEIKEQKQTQVLEAARLKHLAKQKELLSHYREQMKIRNQLIRNHFEEESKNLRKEDEKRKKYIQMQKKHLEAYYSQKKILESVPNAPG